MPYNSINELPESVRNVLPGHAQEIYLAAFNSAWEQYDRPEERREGADREETRPPGRLGGGQAAVRERRAVRKMGKEINLAGGHRLVCTAGT